MQRHVVTNATAEFLTVATAGAAMHGLLPRNACTCSAARWGAVDHISVRGSSSCNALIHGGCAIPSTGAAAPRSTAVPTCGMLKWWGRWRHPCSHNGAGGSIAPAATLGTILTCSSGLPIAMAAGPTAMAAASVVAMPATATAQYRKVRFREQWAL